MSGALRLYTGPLSMFGMKAEIALGEKGLAFERIEVPFDNARGYEPKHPDVLRINPKGQVPVLVHGGLELYDSTQIFEYIEDAFPRPPLWPAAPQDRAQARQAEHFADEVYFPPVIRLMRLQDRLDQPEAQAALAQIAAATVRLEMRLGDNAYLAGAFSYADIAFFMAQVFGERMGAPLAGETPGLLAWRARLGARPAVRLVIARMVAHLRATARPVPDFIDNIATSTKESP